jgi:hypothetical protein
LGHYCLCQWCHDPSDPTKKVWPKFRSGQFVGVSSMVNGVNDHVKSNLCDRMSFMSCWGNLYSAAAKKKE